MLNHNEVFAVCQRVQGMDSRVYLLLADGRGWAFDDSALLPHDPSVIRGKWAPVEVTIGAVYPAPLPMPVFEQPLAAHEAQDAKKKGRRRLRGGNKRNKNKSAESHLGVKAGTYDMMVEVETDIPADASLDADSSNSEVEGALFKEEDFPRLPSRVK
jgi:hypothetical protein